MNGDLDAARKRYLESAEAARQAGSPAVQVVGRELEALRIDIMEDRAKEALPLVEKRLARLEDWWQRHRSGQSVPEAPDPEFLARTLISALDIAYDADRAMMDWDAALRRTDAGLQVKRALQRPAEDIARTRVNRAIALGKLWHSGAVWTELEECLHVFQNDPARRAWVLDSLARLFHEQCDVLQAIEQERRALALCEQLPDPRDRARSHINLANYLEHNGTSVPAESSRHRLAALVYCLVCGLGMYRRISLHNYTIRFRRAHATRTPLVVPSVAEVLADPAFHPLKEWLRLRQAEVAKLQVNVDAFLEQARQLALKQD